mgnify:CR=1 FL=1
MPSARRRMRRIALTPLIDVIFLLLLFFMLSSTFSQFSEVPLVTGRGGGAGTDAPPVFVQLSPDRVLLNGLPVSLADMRDRLGDRVETQVLVSLRGAVDAQRLTDLLVTLGRVPGLDVTVLGDG